MSATHFLVDQRVAVSDGGIAGKVCGRAIRPTLALLACYSISSGEIGVVSLLPTLGNFISPGAISGAVTMKITSSTSITSIYGTTLIWLIDLRGRRMSGLVPENHPCRCSMFENSS